MKKILSISMFCLFCNPVVHADTSVNDNVALGQLEKSAEKSNRKKKLKFEFELGCRARADYFKVSVKKDLKANLLNIISHTNFIKVSANELNATLNGFFAEFPNLQQTINGLTNSQKDELYENLTKIAIVVFKNYGAVSYNEINSEINSICTLLNITHGTPNTWKLLHDANYLPLALCMFDSSTRAKIGNNPTIDSFNNVIKDICSDLVKSKPNNTSPINALSYVNFDIFANFFVNYFFSKKVYLIGGIGGIYDLSGAKGYSLTGNRNKKDSGNEGSVKVASEPVYRTKYGFVPSLGLGIRCGKHFAIELSGFDQITKVEFDCTNAYKSDAFALFVNAIPGMKTLVPEKQSNWVNRSGVKLDFKFIIKDKSFIKLGAFYMFPTNLFRKIQPIDMVAQSAGVSLSLGYIF